MPKELFQYFDNNLRDQKKLNVKFKLYTQDDIPLIPENIEDDDDNNNIVPIQDGKD